MGQFASSLARPKTSVTVRVTTARAQPSIHEVMVEAGRGGGKPGDKEWWVRLWGSSIIISQVWGVWDSSLSWRESLAVQQWMGGGEGREVRCYARVESNQFGGATRFCQLQVTADTELTHWLKLYTTVRQEPLERERIWIAKLLSETLDGEAFPRNFCANTNTWGYAYIFPARNIMSWEKKAICAHAGVQMELQSKTRTSN